MGETSPPTAVDYAADNARTALQQARSLEQRVAVLEQQVASLTATLQLLLGR